MKIPTKYFSIIGIILFIIILSRVNIEQVLAIILNSNYLLLILAFLVTVVELIIRSSKWKILINIFNKTYTLKDAIQTYLIGFAFGAVTPSKTGDVIKVIDLKNKTGIDTKRCVFLSIFDKIIDFLNLILTAIISLPIAILLFPSIDNILIPVFFILLISFILILFSLTRHSRIILKPFYYLTPKLFKNKIRKIFYAFRYLITIVKKSPSFLAYVLLDFFSWFFAYSTSYFLAIAIGLDVPIWYFLLLIPIISIVEVLPITLLGIGSRDLALIMLFAPLGLGKEEIISISMLILLIGLFPKIIIGFLLSWKKNLNTKTKSTDIPS